MLKRLALLALRARYAKLAAGSRRTTAVWVGLIFEASECLPVCVTITIATELFLTRYSLLVKRYR